jgi:hypothetical protein
MKEHEVGCNLLDPYPALHGCSCSAREPLQPPVLKPGETILGVAPVRGLLADLDLVDLTNEVIAILSPVHNGAESMATTARRIVEAVKRHRK